jgi:hypothetical protein
MRRAWFLSFAIPVLACGGYEPVDPWRPMGASGTTGLGEEEGETEDGDTGMGSSSSDSDSTSDEGSTSVDETTSGLGDGSTGSEPDDCPRVRVDVGEGSTLNVRPTPSTMGDPIGSLSHGEIVDRLAEVMGESIGGNDTWYLIAQGELEGFIFSTYATCTLDRPSPPSPPDEWRAGVASKG